jgi:DNA-binding response OmpR family regulator
MELLIVEDNPSTLKMLAFLLTNEGYTVHTAGTGAEGLEILEHEPIDLLVLDVMLPDMSGLQICRKLREEGFTLPILVISALGLRDDKMAALNEGADDYMTKPFDPSEVIARVYSLIRRTQPTLAHHLQTRLCIGNICLHALKPAIVIAGTDRTIDLTKMEAQLLHVLMRNAGHVVEYPRLISEAWGADYNGTSNQLEVYIHRLRSKLQKEAPGVEFIKTIPGSGYEFAKA